MGINLQNRIEKLESAIGGDVPALSDAELLNRVKLREGTRFDALTEEDVALLLTLEQARACGMTFAELHTHAAEREAAQ
jgi:hypothetical protein